MTTIATAIFAALALWIVARMWKRAFADRRFGASVNGGRSGTITIQSAGRPARANYEVGATVYFLVYRSSLAWASGEPLSAAERTDMVHTLRRWAKERGSTIEVANDG
jgi:hypothetical protein